MFAGATTSVNVFTAFGATPLLAVTVIGNEPAVVGVPERTPAELIVIPPAIVAGLTANVGAGLPVIPVKLKLYGEPTVPPDGVPVKPGATSVFAGATTSVNVFTAFGVTPLLAVTVIGNEPAVVGVPDKTPAELIVIPPAIVAGLTANVGAGEPVIPVKLKLYGEPTVPPDGVPVNPGATPAAAAGRVMVRNTWSLVATVLLVDTRTWQFVKSGSPFAGEACPGARQLKMPLRADALERQERVVRVRRPRTSRSRSRPR